MGDSSNKRGNVFHRPNAHLHLDYSALIGQYDSLAQAPNLLESRPDLGFSPQTDSSIPNSPNPAEAFYISQSLAFLDSALVNYNTPHPSHQRHGFPRVYSSVQQPLDRNTQAPEWSFGFGQEWSFGFNGQAVSPTSGGTDYIQSTSDVWPLHKNLSETLEQDDDTESIHTATTSCDSHCGLDDPCTQEECAGQDDACTDKNCPGEVCPDTNCPAKLTSEDAFAAATLTAIHNPARQQTYESSQGENDGQNVSSTQRPVSSWPFGASTVNPLDLMSHIAMAHNNPASYSCTRPCLIDNPQVFSHCPFPASLNLPVNPYPEFDNSLLMAVFNDDGTNNILSHGHAGFIGCGAEISDPDALVQHFKSQHRHIYEAASLQGTIGGLPAPALFSTKALPDSTSDTIQPSRGSAAGSPMEGPYPPTPLSLCQEVSNPSNLSSHRSRSSTVSRAGTGNEWEQQCLWCDQQSGQRCGQIFHDSEALFAHVNADHIQTLEKFPQGFVCSWENCKRQEGGKEGFPQRSKIERHMHTHIGLKPFACQTCGQKFSAQQALTQHLLIHTNEKPLRCDWEGCGKTFRQQSALTMHRRIHTGDKPLKCPICGKAFSESSNLSKHKRIHEKTGRYACQELGCTRSFHRLDQLRRHSKLHEGSNNLKEK